MTSFQEEATPICGLSQSSSVIPTARSMARAGARAGPSVTSWLRGFIPTSGSSDGSMGVWAAIPAWYGLRRAAPVAGLRPGGRAPSRSAAPVAC